LPEAVVFTGHPPVKQVQLRFRNDLVDLPPANFES
jgi:hypothetical protein